MSSHLYPQASNPQLQLHSQNNNQSNQNTISNSNTNTNKILHQSLSSVVNADVDIFYRVKKEILDKLDLILQKVNLEIINSRMPNYGSIGGIIGGGIGGNGYGGIGGRNSGGRIGGESGNRNMVEDYTFIELSHF